MNCRYCKKEIEPDSVFCRFCGERVRRTRKPKEEITVPPPTVTPSGKYRGRVTLHGLRHSFASLAYHLRWTEKTTMRLGGWATPDVVHEIYTHLAHQDVDEDVERMKAFYDAVSKSVSKFAH